MINKLDSDETDKREAIFHDLQVDYDKYVKLYQNGGDENRNRTSKSLARKSSDNSAFQSKWADYLIDEADDDLRPLIGLDP